MNKTHSKELADSFEKDGYIHLKQYLSPNSLTQCREAIEGAVAQLETESGLNAEGLVFHSNLYRHSEALAQWLASAPLSNLLELLAKEAVWVRWDQQITKQPGGVVFPWHRDNAYNKLKAEHFQCWIPLTEMTPENGALWLQPGSHRWDASEHRKEENHWVADCDESQAICVHAQPGDLVLFSSKLFHKTGINQTKNPRIAYVAEYMRQSDFDPGVSAPYLFVSNQHPHWVQKHPKRGRLWRPSNAVITGTDIESKRRV